MAEASQVTQEEGELSEERELSDLEIDVLPGEEYEAPVVHLHGHVCTANCY